MSSYYYKNIDVAGRLISLYAYHGFLPNVNDPFTMRITHEEYLSLSGEIEEKALLVDSLYSGAITIEDVPVEWCEEIQRRVDERIAEEGAAEDQDISVEEALNIILGVSE